MKVLFSAQNVPGCDRHIVFRSIFIFHILLLAEFVKRSGSNERVVTGKTLAVSSVCLEGRQWGYEIGENKREGRRTAGALIQVC